MMGLTDDPLTWLAGGALFLLWYVLSIIKSAASSILSDEFKVSAPDLVLAVVARSLDRLPEGDRREWEETWLADLAQLEDKPLQALWYSISQCLFASRALARTLSTSRRALRTSPVTQGFRRAAIWSMAGKPPPTDQLSTRLVDFASRGALLPYRIVSSSLIDLGWAGPLSHGRTVFGPRLPGAVWREVEQQPPERRRLYRARGVAGLVALSALVAVGYLEVIRALF